MTEGTLSARMRERAPYESAQDRAVRQCVLEDQTSPPESAGVDSSLRIEEATVADIPRLAALHRQCLPRDFLARLGESFLRRVLYPALMESDRVTMYAARRREDGDIVGLLITRIGLGGLLRDILHSYPIRFFLCVSAAVLRRPALLRDTWSIFAQLRSRATQREHGLAELFLLAVSADARRRGVGSALIEHSANALRRRGVRSYVVYFHADNRAADAIYAKASFLPCQKEEEEPRSGSKSDSGAPVWRVRERNLL